MIQQKVRYKYLIIDTTNFFFKCYHSIIKGHDVPPEKVTPEQTCLIINLMLELKSYIKSEFAYDNSEIYFLFDNSQSKINIRKLIDEGYKSDRDKQHIPKNIYGILKLYSNILKVWSTDYRILFSENLEADDLVKPLIDYLKPDHQNQILLISDDLDWSRSISDWVHWYNWGQEVNDKDNFYRRFQFFPTSEKICAYKAVLGDPSDSIKPVVSREFPRKEFIEILNQYDNLKSIISAANNRKFSEKVNKELIENTRLLRRNYDLVYFMPVEKSIPDITHVCRRSEFQVKVLLKSLNIEIPAEFLSNEEIETNFFKV